MSYISSICYGFAFKGFRVKDVNYAKKDEIV